MLGGVSITHSGGRLLLVLLCMDFVFLLLHVLHRPVHLLADPNFSVEQDRGYAEFFQYSKEAFIAILMAWLAVHRREPHYAAWSGMFAFLLADDSFQIHERIGLALAEKLNLLAMLGLRGRDFGELIITGAVAVLFLSVILISGVQASPDVRKHGVRMGLVLVGVALFGVAADMLHQMVSEHRALNWLGGIVEDWGEMLAMSIGCAYAFDAVHHPYATSVAAATPTVGTRRAGA